MTHEAGRELDAEVAEKVMGLVRCQGSQHKLGGRAEGWECWAQADSPTRGGELPSYSTDITDAWKVVEQFQLQAKLGHMFVLRCAPWEDYSRSSWEVGQVRPLNGWWGAATEEGGLYSFAPTAPLAICLAALKAVTP